MGFLDDKENLAPNAAASSNLLLESLMEQLPMPTVRYVDDQGQSTQILYIGESARSIFMLEKATERRLRLVIALKEAPRSATKWLMLLRCPLGGNPGIYNKQRLLRRALTCVDSETARETAEYTEMCIMLAKLSEWDSEKGVRRNFQEMAKRRVGEKQPLRYEEEAAFEYEAGNTEVAEEILERGVDNDALTPIQKKELLKQVIAGRAGWVAAFSGSLQEQKVLALRARTQALRRIHSNSMTNRAQNAFPGDTTPSRHRRERDTPTVSSIHVLTTPSNATSVTHDRNGEGFLTVSKLQRGRNKSPLLTTPLVPTRSSLKSQSTSRKSPARFMFGGPPLRVIVTNFGDEDDNDDDDAMMESQTTPTMISKPTPPVKIQEADKASSASPATKSETMPKPKIDVGDISHILKWNPEKDKGKRGTNTESKDTEFPLAKSAKPTATIAQVKNPVEKKQFEKPIEALPVPSAVLQGLPRSREVQAVSLKNAKFIDNREDAALGVYALQNRSVTRAHDNSRSPKRRQLDPSVVVTKNHADVGSPSSVSSSSSPPVASMSSALSQDALVSLTSRVVVNGLKYIKLEQIGSGGSSKVYRMLGPDLKIYALKKIKLKKLDAQSIAQYTNEIELLKRLQGNPHIIKLIAAEQDLQQRQINVVMEHGEIDLSERLRNLNGGMDENLLRVIWTQMLQAVDAIHRMRIIHGDLKPANFLFVNGALKLIDFGIAKAIPSNDTTNIERDSQIGTINFMSPEAIQGNTLPNGERDPEGKMKVGRASDIWSLGCILYQIVYSKPPFADVRSIIDKFRCIIDPAVPIPFPPLQNQDLEDVIRSCLQRDHRRRPPITGERGLLSHPFLRSRGSSACVSSITTVAMSNAPQILSQLGDLLHSQGLPSDRVNMFMSIGLEGLRKASSDVSRTYHVYNTQERRTDI